MDGVFWVLSLHSRWRFNLLKLPEKSKKILHDFRDAPNAIVRLTETLDSLYDNLEYAKLLIDQLTSAGRPSSSVNVLQNALEGCRAKIGRLAWLVDDVTQPWLRNWRAQKMKSSLKLFNRKEEIESARNRSEMLILCCKAQF